MLQAIQGAVGFLTRLPVGTTSANWEAFRRSAYSFPLVGYLIGALAGSVFLLPVQPPTVVAAYLVVLYLSTGLTHADGLADVGDALAVHDDSDRRLAVLKDSATGVGGVLLLGLTLVVTALGALSFAGVDSMSAFRLAVATEVGAKLGMALVICYGTAAHEGLGSQLLELLGQRAFLPALLLAVPALLWPPTGMETALLAALLAGPLVGVATLTWGHRALGGVNGDLIGATNELGRAVGLHLGVSVWILL